MPTGMDDGASVVIHVRSDDDEILYPQYKHCAALTSHTEALRAAVLQDTQWHRCVATLRAALPTVFAARSRDGSELTPHGLFDDVVCRRFHGLPQEVCLALIVGVMTWQVRTCCCAHGALLI